VAVGVERVGRANRENFLSIGEGSEYKGECFDGGCCELSSCEAGALQTFKSDLWKKAERPD